MPLWRSRGYGEFDLGGQRLRFCDVAKPPHDWWAWGVWTKTWEPEVIDFVVQTLRPGDVFFDIGAYHGPYTLLASRLVAPGGRVFAFEPDPVARGLLKRNIAANGASNVVVLPCAVTAKDGPVWLQADELGNAMTAVSNADGVLQVSGVSLKSFCEHHSVSPSVLKIDVEGGEADILTEDADHVFRGARSLVVEIHKSELRKIGVSPSDLLERFTKLGWRIVPLHTRAEGNFNVALVAPEFKKLSA